MKNIVAKLISVLQRDDFIVLTPDDQSRLIDIVCIATDAIGAPVSRSCQQAMLCVSRVERPSDVRYARIVNKMMIGTCKRIFHSESPKCFRIHEPRRKRFADARESGEPQD